MLQYGMAKEPLSPERIVSIALRLADLHGVEGLSMRRLGAELGVEAMSLYHYFANKERLLDALVDAVYGEIAAPPPDLSWVEALRRRCESMREALLRHPWAVGLAGTRAHPGPATLGHLEAVLHRLRSAGLTWTQVGHAVALLDAYVLGFVLQERVVPLQTPEQTTSVAEGLLGPDFLRLYPTMAGFITDHALQPGYRFSAEFGPGLDLILGGLEAAFGYRCGS